MRRKKDPARHNILRCSTPDPGLAFRSMGNRDFRHYPKPQDHSLKVYSAIIGHKPTVAPDGKMIVHPPGAGFWYHACLKWADLRRTLARTQLSPAVRARLLPLLGRALKRWQEACNRFASAPSQSIKPVARSRPSRARPLQAERNWRPRATQLR